MIERHQRITRHRRASNAGLIPILALAVITFGAGGAQARHFDGYGSVYFHSFCTPAADLRVQKLMARLHSFDWIENDAAAVAKDDPGCAIAWWIAAMSARGNPLAGELSDDSFKSGRQYTDLALKAETGATSEKERALIAAMDIYYRDYGAGGHAARTRAYAAAMQRLQTADPDDPELTAFDALAILETVDLTDKTYAQQLKAAALLEPLRAQYPDHPGATHYLIHAYDYAPLAARGLAAARAYASIAPKSVHAQHMPSHIFSMLGLWKESIHANHESAEVLDPRLHSGAREDSVDPHGMDFIAYARLQLAQDKHVAAAIAAADPSPERRLVQARYVLERGDWTAASALNAGDGSALDQVTAHFTRSVAAARGGNAAAARQESDALHALRDPVEREDGGYWAGLVDVYAAATDAWIAASEKRGADALTLMAKAADLDDAREKHIALENKLIPMREMYGELLFDEGQPANALAAFKTSLAQAPNRYRSFLGAARAAREMGRTDEARQWYGKVIDLTANSDSERPGIVEARAAL